MPQSPRTRWATALLLAISCLLAPSCATCYVWEEIADHDAGRVDWSDGGTISAIALTPVAVSVDVALAAGLLWFYAATSCCDCECLCDCP